MNELTFSVSPIPSSGNAAISATYTIFNSTISTKYYFKLYVKPKGAPDTSWSKGYWSITAHTGVDIGVEVGRFEFNWSVEFEAMRMFCGSDWDIKITAGSGGSNVITKNFGFLSSDPVHPDTFYTIPERPTQQSQNVIKNGIYFGEAGTCVANACASAKEILEMRKGKNVLNYSICWFFGSDNEAQNGMYMSNALNTLRSLGIPPYEVVENEYGIFGYPDAASKSESRAIFSKNGHMPQWALPQKISGSNQISSSAVMGPWNIARIQNAIKRKGSTVIVEIIIDESLDDTSARDTGWVGPIRGSARGGHAMIVLGYEVNNGVRYWIVQNSWINYHTGQVYGKQGIYYIPWNWFKYPDLDCGLLFFYELIDDPNAPILPPLPIHPLKPPVFTNLNQRGKISVKWLNSRAEKYQLRVYVDGKTSNWIYKDIQGALEYTWEDYSIFESGYTVKIGISEYKNGKWNVIPGETIGTIVPWPIGVSGRSTTATNVVASLDLSTAHGKASGASVRRHRVGSTDVIDSKSIQIREDAKVEWTGLKTGDLWDFSSVTYIDTSGGRIWSYYKSVSTTVKVGAFKPELFKWEKSDPKESGKAFDVTKVDWDNLTKTINQMLVFQNKPQTNFTAATKGQPLTKAMFDQVRNSIYNLHSVDGYIPTAIQNKPITAEHMNKVKECLNSVIKK